MEEMGLDIDLTPLDFTFTTKPLIIGGCAMQYHGLRKAGADIDLVITNDDYQRLARQYPDHRRDLWGDLGVCVHGFEIWRTIALYDYAFWSVGAVEERDWRVMSLERLLYSRVLAIKNDKHRRDLDLIVARMLSDAEPERLRYLEGTPLDQFARHAALVILGDIQSSATGEPTVDRPVTVRRAWSLSDAQLARQVIGTTVTVAGDAGPVQAGPHLMLLAQGPAGQYELFGNQAIARLSGETFVHSAPLSPLGKCLHGQTLTEVTQAIERALAD
jgi:hypothetical protein